ncbi:MAG TPA: hypothetical protein VJ464_15520 [Blastocatellia bacterium]|nr:hypothetical protein [Blastocatellia bacterium]
MPIKLPNLDDRTYASLVEEARAMIPVYAPEWTNHNESDPGITLVEMLAFVTEMLIYRLNRVTVENVIAFLNLIDYKGARKAEDYPDRARLTEEVRRVVTELRTPYRAVTYEDFNRLVLGNFPEQVARVFTTTLKDKRNDKPVDVIKVFVVPVLRPTVLVNKDNGYSDHSSDIRKPGHIQFHLVSQESEYLYVGMESKFDAIRFNLHTRVAGRALKFTYSQGGDEDGGEARWANLPVADLTAGWAASGLVAFTPPTDWQPSTVNGKEMYWVRVAATKPPERAEASAYQVAVQSVPLLPEQGGDALLNAIKADLATRKLLTTRLNVAGPSYKRIAVKNVTLHLKPGAVEADAEKAAQEELSRFFHPLIGWRDGNGWPFGRAVYLSEIIERLAGLPGVNFVAIKKDATPLQLIDPATGRVTQQAADFIKLEPFELVDFQIIQSEFATETAPQPRGLKK